MNTSQPSRSATLVQLLVSFVIPVIILARFSGEAQLGPARGMLLALAFPVGYEVYNFFTHKKPSYLSLFAIGGILLTGGISLLGLSEDWLAVRRAVPYLAAALVIMGSIIIKRPLLPALLPYFLDMDLLAKHTRGKRARAALERTLTRCSVMLSILLLILAIISFVLTKALILSPTDTSAFNQEFAKLRLVSLAAVTLPLLVGVTALLFYLVSSLEKLTGLEFDQILKKK